MTSDGYLLHLYMREDQRHHHEPLWQWLLAAANGWACAAGPRFAPWAALDSTMCCTNSGSSSWRAPSQFRSNSSS